MKKIILSVAACVAAISMNAQTIIFQDDFNDQDISDWTLYDQDGDGNNWGDLFQIGDGQGGFITPVSLISRSWQQMPLTPDNWAVSPPIDLTNEGGKTITVSWLRQVNDAFPDEHYTLYVGTSDDITVLVNSSLTKDENFTTTPSPETDTPKTITLDISSMAGQVVYLAFRHWDSSDADFLSIDDVTVTSETLGTENNQIAGFDYFYSSQNNVLTLTADEPFSKIELYNILGQRVMAQELSNTEENLSLSSLNTGIYLANVNVNGKVSTFKIVKK
ncbi:MAG TPA: choice-of-anchor J domain-containing protein [Flavobacteriaceae bacterium]|nr:choice-of-anchor J domain-containing protein [Flavobacteriaceae bacterium]